MSENALGLTTSEHKQPNRKQRNAHEPCAYYPSSPTLHTLCASFKHICYKVMACLRPLEILFQLLARFRTPRSFFTLSASDQTSPPNLKKSSPIAALLCSLCTENLAPRWLGNGNKARTTRIPRPPIGRPMTDLAAQCLTLECPWDDGNRPQRNVTANCEHAIETCRDCLTKYINIRMAKSSLDQIQCPSCNCNERLSYEDIEEAVGHDTFEKCAKPSMGMPC